MGFTIAITGKGGSGKTTIAGIIVSQLIRLGKTPVLAVDADPNTSLDSVLGVKAEKSVGTVREELRDESAKDSSMSKRDILEMKIAESLVEGNDFDLITMGRPEGPGCYCYANNLLRDILKSISKSYPYIVIDNEAGLENLSRRIIQKTDLLFMAADSSKRGLDTLQRLQELALEMKIEYRYLGIAINRVRGADFRPESLPYADFIVTIPEDDEIFNAGEKGIPLSNISEENPVVQRIRGFLVELLKNETV